jgi:hypothetical protein
MSSAEEQEQTMNNLATKIDPVPRRAARSSAWRGPYILVETTRQNEASAL